MDNAPRLVATLLAPLTSFKAFGGALDSPHQKPGRSRDAAETMSEVSPAIAGGRMAEQLGRELCS